MDFKIANSNAVTSTVTLEKASATVIEAGDMVALASWLAIKATAASTAIAFCPAGWADGATEIEVYNDEALILKGTADKVFAVTHRGVEVDLVVNTGNQEIDVDSVATKVLKVQPGTKAGTVGSKQDFTVTINKPLF